MGSRHHCRRGAARGVHAAAVADRGRAVTIAGLFTNTDRELWREREGDYYADSIHVTESGEIGINVGGRVVVQKLRDWHAAVEGREVLLDALAEHGDVRRGERVAGGALGLVTSEMAEEQEPPGDGREERERVEESLAGG